MWNEVKTLLLLITLYPLTEYKWLTVCERYLYHNGRNVELCDMVVLKGDCFIDYLVEKWCLIQITDER